MSASRRDPGRATAVLVDGPYAGSVLYTDVLVANIAAARRHPPGHPAGDMARYRPVGEGAAASAAGSGALCTGASADPSEPAPWAWTALSEAEAARRVTPGPGSRAADLASTAGDRNAARERAASRAADADGDTSGGVA